MHDISAESPEFVPKLSLQPPVSKPPEPQDPEKLAKLVYKPIASKINANAPEFKPAVEIKQDPRFYNEGKSTTYNQYSNFGQYIPKQKYSPVEQENLDPNSNNHVKQAFICEVEMPTDPELKQFTRQLKAVEKVHSKSAMKLIIQQGRL